jgi:hypothetical protein
LSPAKRKLRSWRAIDVENALSALASPNRLDSRRLHHSTQLTLVSGQA